MFEQFIGTKPVDDRHRIDVAALEEYLQLRVRGLAQFKGGQSNPTYRITAAAGRRLVLRRKPPGKLLPSAHAVEREYRVTQALHAAGFPVARPHALCEEDSVLGTAFYVMDFVEGRVLWDQSLPGMTRAQRFGIWDELNRVIARLHTIDYRAIGLEGFGKPGNYIGRQILRWTRQYQASATERIEAMDSLIAWLPANIPPETGTAVVHGDFRRIAGLDLQALGIPSENDYIEMYFRRTRRESVPASHWDFYLAYNLFRMAAILQGILKRVVDGTAASAHARDAGMRARPMAELGWKQVEKILRRAA